jgi:hypothetical protein
MQGLTPYRGPAPSTPTEREHDPPFVSRPDPTRAAAVIGTMLGASFSAIGVAFAWRDWEGSAAYFALVFGAVAGLLAVIAWTKLWLVRRACPERVLCRVDGAKDRA